MTPKAERALIRRVVSGDRAAAEQLIRAHQAGLYAYMLRMSRRPEVAEDVVQEAFVRALTHIDRYDPRFRFSTWLFTIAKRLYVNARQRLVPVFDSDVVGSVATAKPTGADGRGGLAASAESSSHVSAALGDALEELTADQREVVVLFYQLQWGVEQIAEYLDAPEGTIKSHLHRARRRMRDMLEAHVVHGERVREAMS